jgi:hypothetical protein
VGSADARSAKIGSRNGISHPLKVSEYSGEPVAAICARNLFAEDDWRLALSNEPRKSWPEVPLVVFASLLPGD